MELNLQTEEQAILEKLATEKNQTIETYLTELIHEKTDCKLTKTQAYAMAYSLSLRHAKESEDIGEVRQQIAGELLVAKILCDYEKEGKVNQEKIKEYIKELF